MLVQNNSKYIRNVGDVRLVPGGNEVPNDLKKQFQTDLKHHILASLVRRGDIELINADDPSDMNADAAVALVTDTVDIQLLNSWKDKDSRKSVLSAIDAKIEELTKLPEDQKDSE